MNEELLPNEAPPPQRERVCRALEAFLLWLANGVVSDLKNQKSASQDADDPATPQAENDSVLSLGGGDHDRK